MILKRGLLKHGSSDGRGGGGGQFSDHLEWLALNEVYVGERDPCRASGTHAKRGLSKEPWSSAL